MHSLYINVGDPSEPKDTAHGAVCFSVCLDAPVQHATPLGYVRVWTDVATLEPWEGGGLAAYHIVL